jgi:hypothetical protein
MPAAFQPDKVDTSRMVAGLPGNDAIRLNIFAVNDTAVQGENG